MATGSLLISIFPLRGIPEVVAGDDLAALIETALKRQDLTPADGDILVVTHKVVSKAEGRTAQVLTDEEYRALVEGEAATIIRRRGTMIITRTRHGFVCANAAVDRSNSPENTAVMLPEDPDRSAHRLRMAFEQVYGCRLGVVITDTFGRAWRGGQVDVAIGISGVVSILDMRGNVDHDGRTLTATQIAVADEMAAAADLAMGKSTGIPVALIRGGDFLGEGRATDLIRDPADDFFL